MGIPTLFETADSGKLRNVILFSMKKYAYKTATNVG
jgi:hypothetical protein